MTQQVPRIAHKLFGVSIIAFGIQQCITGQLVAGRPPAWPSVMPGELVIAYVLGVWLIFNGITILINKKIKSLIPTALFILVYCASRNLYTVLSETDIGASLTNFGKGITIAGGLVLITKTSTHEFNNQQRHNPIDYLYVVICLYALEFFLVMSGIQHFLFADFVAFLIPSWIPFPLFWTYASGAALVITGLSLIMGIRRQLVTQLGAMMILTWIIVLHIPRVVQDLSNHNEWTSVFEAIAFSSLLFIIANTPAIESILSMHKQYDLVRNK
jgi:uncharacterized membrane protein